MSRQTILQRGRSPARRNPADARRLRRSLVASTTVHLGLFATLFSVPILYAPRGVAPRPVHGTIAFLEVVPPEPWTDEVEPEVEVEPPEVDPAPSERLPEIVPLALPETAMPELDEPPPLDALDLSPGRIERLVGNGRLDGNARADAEPEPVGTVAAEPTPAAASLPSAAAPSNTRETPPVPIPGRCRRPAYPARAERLGQSGFVVCRITVAVDGRVTAVHIEASSGHEVLDRAAVEAVERWEFSPGTRGGEPVEMDVLKRLWFRLDA